ncbi:MAG: ribose transport system ATP-binding protein [Pseudonocardia sp.]
MEVAALTKSFGGVRALRGVSVSFEPGQVHALLGENGAGKSTLVNCLSGILSPDSGELRWQGEPVSLDKPAAARALGIQTIHQEFELVPTLTVAENVLLGRLPRRFVFARPKETIARAREVTARLGLSADVQTRVSDLEVADQQLVEIAKALVDGTRVLIMDEPTAALPADRVERLLSLIRALAADGMTIIYVSHRLDEIMEIADCVTVLRNGSVTASMRREELTHDGLVRAIVGHIPEAITRTGRRPATTETVRLANLSAGRLTDVTAHACAGEVVGFFGLVGAGQQAIAEVLTGRLRIRGGGVTMLGDGGAPRSPRQAVKRGVGYVPADRKAAGLALGLPLVDNVLLGRRSSAGARAAVPTRDREHARRILREAGVVFSDPRQQAGQLSGGNQQKIVLARWMSWHHTCLLLLNEPTRGVDIGAKAEIHRALRAWASDGGTVVLSSADAEETAAVCDRVYVMSRGRVVAELSDAELTDQHITAAALAG